MIHKEEFFDQIEDYCLEQLSEDLKVMFEEELKVNPELSQELEFRMEIRDAILEKDVLTLREKLKNVAVNSETYENGNESFELLNEFSDIQELKNVLTSEELIQYYDSLPKVHAYHHETNSNENIHQIYKDQIEEESKLLDEDFDELDLDLEMELEGLEEAILEKDILNLRQTLAQVAKSVEPQFTVEEIDGYINGELTGNELIDFEKDLAENRSLREEFQLHRDIEEAIQEFDLMDLRNKLSTIIQSETSWNVSEQSIEDFIDGVLEGDAYNEFVTEFNDNTDLMAEVNLRRQINDAIIEKDIMGLRNKLRSAKEVSEVRKVKMLVPEAKTTLFRYIRSSVAVIILLLGIGGILRNGFTTGDNVYSKFYSSPTWSPERSVSNELTNWHNANYAYMNNDWQSVIGYMNEVKAPLNSGEYAVAKFLKAASLQNLNKFNEAVTEYSKVIDQGDNLFIEEAEWYRSLCYIKLGKKEEAKQELFAVIDRKGLYENDAKTVLRKLRYSVKIN